MFVSPVNLARAGTVTIFRKWTVPLGQHDDAF